MDNKLFKILIVGFLVWAIASTSALAYYYTMYQELSREYEALDNRVKEYQSVISDLEDTLAKVRGSLRDINSSYQELFKNYSETLEKLSRLIKGGYVNMVIDFGNGTRKFYKFYIIIGENNTVFDVLKATGLDLGYTEYPEMDDVFINCIAGVCGQQTGERSGMYWMLFVNTELSSAGAKQTKVLPGYLIEWVYKEVTW